MSAYFSFLAVPIVIAIVIFAGACIFIFEKPWIGVLLVGFFLPFERIGGIDLIGQTTIRISQVLALVTIVSFVLFSLFIKKENRINPNPILWPLLAFIAICAISLINAENLSRALAVFLFTLFVIVFTLVIPKVVTKTSYVKKIVIVLMLSAVLVSLFGLYQFAGDVVGLPETLTGLRSHYTKEIFGFPRVHSTETEPLYFANYLLIPIAIGAMLFLEGKSHKVKKKNAKNGLKNFFQGSFFLIGTVVLCIIALGLTLSRGGYLGLATTAIMIFVLGFRRIFKVKNVAVLFILIILVVLIIVGFLNYSGKFSVDIFTEQATTYKEGVGVTERYDAYREAWRLFWRHPILGIGIGNFGPEIAAYPNKMPETGWKIVNNEPLELLAETGIFGFVAILGMVIILIVASIRAMKALNRQEAKDVDSERIYLRAVLSGFLAAFVGILVQYQTFSTLYVMHVWFVIGMLAALLQISTSFYRGIGHRTRDTAATNYKYRVSNKSCAL